MTERRCEKIAYPDAVQAANKARDLRRTHGRRLRTYLCPKCWQWHLTSKDGL